MEINLASHINSYLDLRTKAASLAVFRFFFGLIMVLSLARFWNKGWIEKLYLTPTFHFHYEYFHWINIPSDWVYLIFLFVSIAALFIAIGFQYRTSIIIFFLGFTYIELWDKTLYLNHYYLVSIISFIMIWLPANVSFSVDSKLNSNIQCEVIPKWNVDLLKLLMAIVYIYAGLAKLNYDWMINAMPLSLWLPNKLNVQILSDFIQAKWMHYVFSWGGALYDLTIVFLLFFKRTRILGFGLVILFHTITKILFPIGMFPFIMIGCTLIFFSAQWHENLLLYLNNTIKLPLQIYKNKRYSNFNITQRIGHYVLPIFIIIQLLFPWRYILYNDNVFWTEQGYRFSWRVMLMEKTGVANFKIKTSQPEKQFYVQNDDFLTALQQKEMVTQPDFILEYGQYLGKHFTDQGHNNVEVYVDSYAALNGRPSQAFIHNDINLLNITIDELYKSYIFPLNE